MADTRADRILTSQAAMEADRANLDNHCQEVAERVLPTHQNFHNVKTERGIKRNEKVFDSTAALALDKFASAIDDLVTPRASTWHELTVAGLPFAELAPDVQAALQEVNKALFRARYAPRSNFASEASTTYTGLGAFGNGSIFVDEDPGRGVRYRSIPFAETWWAENHQGMIDTVHRKFELEARQWVQMFGDETPAAIAKCAEKEPHRRFELIHCVQPREDADWSRADYQGMANASYYVSFEERKLLRERGYRKFPYAIARYKMAPREIYGRGPAMTVLPDIKMVNEQAKSLMRAGQLHAEPPLLLSDDGLTPFKLAPNALIHGGIDFDGRERVKALEVGGNMPITMEMVLDTRSTINEAFLVTLFQVLVDKPGQMTATEAMMRAQEKGALLAPTMGRLQSEMLGPLIEAELDILARNGLLPDLPDFLYDAEVSIEYTSPLAKAQRADQGVAILRLLEDAASVAQFDPAAVSVIRGDVALRRLAEVRGAPVDILRTPDEMAALEAERVSTDQLKTILGAGALAASTAKDAAGAQALLGASPAQVAPPVIPA
ncbi:MAG: portal protein [Caulobacter sp.]